MIISKETRVSKENLKYYHQGLL
jgi:hypothetical protein